MVSLSVSRRNLLEEYARERPGAIAEALLLMRDEIRQTKIDITDYLEDRGDDMSFVYQQRLEEIVSCSVGYGTSRAVDECDISAIQEAASLFDTSNSAIQESLNGLKASVAGLQMLATLLADL